MSFRLTTLLDKLYELKGIPWHEHFYSSCLKLHMYALPHKVDVLLFRNFRLWEPNVSGTLVNTSGELFVDVGACIGRYTILLGEKYKRIIAIEPEPRNMQILKSNVKYAGLTNVQFLECAVSDKNGYGNLYLGGYQWHSLCPKSQNPKIKVKTLTLASILGTHCVADLIKVDVEGAEWLVLKGAESIIDRVKSWIVEIHQPKRKKEVHQWFISHGYSVRWLEPKQKIHIYAMLKHN